MSITKQAKPMGGSGGFDYISGGSVMSYKCDYTISFDNSKRMTVVFTVRQVIARDFTALTDFFTIRENKPEGEAVDCGGDTYPSMVFAVRAIKARLLVQYGITGDKIVFGGIQID